MADESGKIKGLGFVSFEDSESAEKAVKELNGVKMFGKKPGRRVTTMSQPTPSLPS